MSRRRLHLLPLVLLLGIVVWAAVARPSLVGDSHGLAIKSENVAHCLGRGQFTECDRRADGHLGGMSTGVYRLGAVGPFPLMQYLVAVPLRAAGVGADRTLRVLIALDAAALLGTLALVWRTCRRRHLDTWPAVLVLALVVSPLLWYSTVAFGEVLAGFLLLLVVVAVLDDWSSVAVLAAAAAGAVTKETSPPFVVALGLVAAAANERWRPGDASRPLAARARAWRVVPLVAGAAVGTALNLAFNVFRFGSLWNTPYLEVNRAKGGGHLHVQRVVSIFTHRDGGLLWFWPAALAVVAVCVLVTARSSGRGWRRWLPMAVPALLAGQVLGLATWYSPFGWIAWGPRLELPMIVPLLLLAAATCGPDGAAVLRPAVRSGWAWVLGALLVVAGLPQLGWSRVFPILRRYFQTTTVCPPRPLGTRATRAEWCHRVVTGPRIPILVDGLRTLRTPLGAATGAVFVAAVVGLLVAARRDAGETTA